MTNEKIQISQEELENMYEIVDSKEEPKEQNEITTIENDNVVMTFEEFTEKADEELTFD